MLERKALKDIENWRKNRRNKCLLIRGARQVGKTYLVERFAEKNYKSVISLNFELQPEYRRIFDGNLDVKTIMTQIMARVPGAKLIPGKTLLFLDEIQTCPNARTAMKSLSMSNEFDTIASGSLLGLHYKDISSIPVGYESYLDLYPLDFEEFLWAIGIDTNIIDLAREAFLKKELMDQSILELFEEYFALYLIIGGMPEVVNDYVKNGDTRNVATLQNDLIEGYKSDVLKYAPATEKQRVLYTLASVPAQLAKKNKKFQFVDVDEKDSNPTSNKYSGALTWLNDAGVINQCFNLTEPAQPLAAYKRLEAFKVYMLDTGLLVRMSGEEVPAAILDDNILVNKGAIMENVCAEELINHHRDLTYFERKSVLEIDFMLSIKGELTALEVKSGHNKQAKSLDSIVENYKDVSRYIMLEHKTNVYVDEKGIEHYPLFMIMFI